LHQQTDKDSKQYGLTVFLDARVLLFNQGIPE
jgi:hypothetical protein